MSHGNVAKKRYRIIERSGLKTLGHGWTTGHQNRSPATRNDDCSIKCHAAECIGSTNTGGMCHTTNAAAEASQQSAIVLRVWCRTNTLVRQVTGMIANA